MASAGQLPNLLTWRLAPHPYMEFRLVPAGEFTMGSRGYQPAEEPCHRVRIARDFYMGSRPVSQAQLAVWTRETQREHRNDFEGRWESPATGLFWSHAMEYCRWLNTKRGDCLPRGYVATLPTEAEWEYACRAGTDTEYWSGDGEAALAAVGWYRDNAEEKIREIGSNPRGVNPWGLADMHGNVKEWCWDKWNPTAYSTRVDGICDPGSADRARMHTAPDLLASANVGLESHVARGGDFNTRAWACRSAFRWEGWPETYDFGPGFRVCLVSISGGAPGREER